MSAPIGIFDSGIGGLTVLNAIARALPDETFVFLGDTARLPYGSKSPETIRKYNAQNIAFLKREKVKAVVVACSSASSHINANENFGVPVYTVIEPGALSAVEQAPHGPIGVLGTNATVAAGAYQREIHNLAPSAKVFQQAAPLLVPLVEEGWIEDPITDEVLRKYLAPLLAQNIRALILGCTHYPALKPAISRIIEKHRAQLTEKTGTLADEIPLIDSADAVARELRIAISTGKLKGGSKSAARLRLCLTDASPTFVTIAKKLLHDLALPTPEVVTV